MTQLPTDENSRAPRGNPTPKLGPGNRAQRRRRLSGGAGVFALVGLTLAVSACGADKPLAPQVPGDFKPLDARAAVQLGSVDVTINMDAWEGESEIEEKYMPVYLSFHNGGDEPVQIAHGDLVLLSQSRDDTPATPVDDINDVIVTTLQVNTVGDTIPYERIELQLPTERMTVDALQFGEIPAGQKLAGFAYFKQIPDDARDLALTLRTHNASGGAEESATIPLLPRDR